MKIKNYVIFLLGLVLINGYAVVSYGAQDKNSVNVNIKYNIVYARDGKKVIEVGDVLIRDKDIYISLEDLQEILGSEISFQDNTVNVKSKSEIEENQNTIKLDRAEIIHIDSIQNELTLLPCDAIDEEANYIVLQLDEDCEIIYKELNKEIPLNMLSEGMIISAEYQEMSNELEQVFSRAIKITILEDVKEKEEPSLIIENVEIIGIDKEKGHIEVAYIGQDKENIESQVIIHIDKNTNIIDENNKSYTIEDLEIGQKIKVITNGILTQSMPPQTLGLELIIMNKSELLVPLE
ncbi:MAG: hypothetical protein RSA85_04425 [Cellulosilyticaceae bacterium]